IPVATEDVGGSDRSCRLIHSIGEAQRQPLPGHGHVGAPELPPANPVHLRRHLLLLPSIDQLVAPLPAQLRVRRAVNGRREGVADRVAYENEAIGHSLSPARRSASGTPPGAHSWSGVPTFATSG